MKKQVKVINQLSFDKDTISRLDEDQLRDFVGGVIAGTFSCHAAALAEQEDHDLESCCDNSCNAKTYTCP
jgi:hypothetical protein